MTIDPQVRALLDSLAGVEASPLAEQSVADVRASGAILGQFSLPEEVAAVEAIELDGPAGPIPARCYRPVDAPASAPALVWYHGGGFVIGDLDTTDGVCRALCRRAGIVVVSVDYRLAPEHPFPAAYDDALAAFDQVRSRATELGIDGDRVAVGGDSAGGNLAGGVAQARRGAVGFQLLVYPVCDLRHETGSYVENAEGYMLTAELMDWFESNYVTPDQIDDPRASIARVEDLSGLAPALVLTAGLDPLRDEGEAYAEAMRSAGVAVEAIRYDGLIHGFFQMSAVIEATGAALDASADALRTGLA